MMGLPAPGPTGIVKKVPRKQNANKEKLALEALIHRYASGWGFTVQKEFFFHPVRRWRFDWYIPELRVAIEYNGLAIGNNQISRHQTVTGITGDCEKINQAQIMGFIVLQYTGLTLKPGFQHYEQFAADFPLLVASKGQNIIEKK